MSTTEMQGLCEEVEDSLAELLDGLLDGNASARLYDHVAECDACRDRKHEAQIAAERVRDAGADFRPAASFVDDLVSQLDAKRSSRDATSSGPKARTVEDAVAPSALESNDATTSASATTQVLEAAENATVFDPLAAAKVAAAEGTFVTQPSASVLVEPALPEAPAASGVSATTAPGAASAAPARDDAREAVATPRDDTPEAVAMKAAPAKLVPPAPAPARRAPVKIGKRQAYIIGAVGAMAAAAAVGFFLKGRASSVLTASVDAPWSGSVTSVARAAADKSGGLDVCDASGHCVTAAAGAQVKAGATLRTDARTRAHVTLADGTELAIDRASEVELAGTQSRAARLKHGSVVADVAHVDGRIAHVAFPRGDVEVLGTKLAVTATDDRASIEVARGSVRVTSDAGKAVEVRAGEEALLAGGSEPVVSSSTTLADMMEWSDDKPEDVDAPVLRGLGELRARKPGQTKEKDHAVRLAKHGVKVRIVDVMAKTEVDETFTNDTDEELEGIFRFPLPPGAQIEKLSLEVDGKMIDGAFVDRDKGAAIWRGVIQNAAPKAPKPKEEIIWVPGPWRDPALLEWQRGGRFELKIFPIPKRGSRRVVLAYTQTVDQAGGVRRFTYPLAHDPSGSTRIGAFDLDLQVLGLDPSMGVQTRGYELGAVKGDGDRRTMHAVDFVPAGDLTVEYALPDRGREVTAWAYAPPPSAARPAAPVTMEPQAAPNPAPAKPAPAADPRHVASANEKAAQETANAILDDRSPFVAIALRPRLPRWQEAKERVHVVVVDASRSMFGERFARATHLASAIVREMDRRDSFVLLACDTVCRSLASDGGAGRPQAPGAAAAGEVERFLGSIEPDGGSDLAAAMTAARTAAGSLGSKDLRIVYLGDGTPSVGPTRPAHLEAAVRSALPSGDAAVIAVALGADADTTSLASLARGGGGVMVPYVPGQKIATAALEVLSAAYGVVLRDPEIDLPPGLSQVTPARLDPIRAGGETILVARMTGGDVSGNVRLRGRVAGERFEQSYPLRVTASSSAGNAFVPRLYAAAKIAELERTGGDAQKPVVIELSKRFAVASRFTSLLVLESEAMFKAFGLDRNVAAPTFDGELRAESSNGRAEGGPTDDADAPLNDVPATPVPAASAFPQGAKPAPGAEVRGANIDESASGRGGMSRRAPVHAAPAAPPAMAAPEPASAKAEASRDDVLPADKPMTTPAPPAPARVATDGKEKKGGGDRWSGPREVAAPRRQRLIPMRKVFDRHVAFETTNTFVGPSAAKLPVAESALQASPDSRDKTVELFALYATSGRLGEAQELTAKWAGRDALDPEALAARADLAARQGDRDRAVRILGGLADIRPNDRAVQVRLADLHDTAGNAALACEHRIALADLAPSEPKLVAAAIACARSQGMNDLASVLRLDTTDKVRDALDKLLASPSRAPVAAHGDLQITADWTGGVDLDLALIDAQGKRISWLGAAGKGTVAARDVTSTRNESLDLVGLPQGSYVLEIARAAGRDAGDVVRGDVTLRLAGETRKVPFTLSGARAELGTVRVFFTSRLEPVEVRRDRWPPRGDPLF